MQNETLQHKIGIVLLVLNLLVTACSSQSQTDVQFKQLPSQGWNQLLPLSFAPIFVDSMQTYDLAIVVRHSNNYAYRNLPLVVDCIADDSTLWRQQVQVVLADNYGGWLGGGFGSLYQCVIPLATDVRPQQVHKIILWQVMDSCSTLKGIEEIGVISTPHSAK